MLCRHGGTGRRAGLKIPFWQQSAGSIPAGGIFYKNLVLSTKAVANVENTRFFGSFFFDEMRNHLCKQECMFWDAFCGKDASL